MIPFFHVIGASLQRYTPEQALARQLAHLPPDTQPVRGSLPLGDFLSDQSGDAAGLIFDAEFWYGRTSWRRWLEALQTDGLDNRPNVPRGNQEPTWRHDVTIPTYVTLRGLERAADTIQAARWEIVPATRPTCFAVVVFPLKYLCALPPTLQMQELPEYGARQRVPLRLFGEGWLHSFNALKDAGCRRDLLSMTDWYGTVLELGCDRGLMARACKEMGHGVTWIGIDLNRIALQEARPFVDWPILADATLTLPLSENLRVDRLVCGDFLEHLAYPWRTLKRLPAFMSPKGQLIAAFPNVGHWSIVEDLLAGRWDATPSGLLCVSHLRFGTRASWQHWLAEAGWQVVRWETEQLALPQEWQDGLRCIAPALDIPSLETLRYRVVAQVAQGSRICT